jgi:predicted methyltransferase
MRLLLLAIASFAALAACASATTSSPPPAIAAIVAAPDRSADDRALDGGRHPGEMLAFFGIAPGMKVAELGAGTGYTSELLARAVGPTGKVFAQNNAFVLGFANDAWTKRLATAPMKNVVRVDREFDDPLPPEAKDLDAVVVVLFYHDTYWMKTDRAKMNHAVFAALKPGGVYGIVDHSARAGAGATEVQTNHRIEESEVIADVTKAGFKLSAEASFLRNPADTRDWNDSPRSAGAKRGTSDRFVLKFVKP